MERSNYKSEIPIFEFHGGIHPEEHKLESNQTPIQEMTIPKQLVINLKGQAGNRSLPVVNVGDKVLKGQVIAESDGIFSTFQHAPTSGTVVAIEKRPIAHPSGLDDLCVVIETDGQDKWCELYPKKDILKLGRAISSLTFVRVVLSDLAVPHSRLILNLSVNQELIPSSSMPQNVSHTLPVMIACFRSEQRMS